jgi:hypothetical protein
MTTAGEGRCQVWLRREDIGNDIIYILGGGERPHLGGAVLMQPGMVQPERIQLGTHHDNEVLEPLARAACEKYNATVIAVGGIHIDNATKAEIEQIVENCKELLKCI